ncbi:glyoxalase superfamily protein [Pseudomonas sp. XWY-1]|uniref:glyoxalase superfamily protein n=1 Tax=Pseudomonas sp. XWY-1 TaxID=2069256 RepID=UPI000CF3B6EB|nr:glyoxalase superfamily protein [Pseudomonas sp. XWY-1]
MPKIETLKMQAKRLRVHLSSHNMPVTHSQSLEAVAAMHGHRNWNTAVAKLTRPLVQPPLRLEVTRDSTPENLHASLQALLRLAPDDVIRFQLAPNLSVELVHEAQIMADQVGRVGIPALIEESV